MNFKEFIKFVAERIGKVLGDDYRIESTSVRKNNGVNLSALIIRCKDDQVTPVVYMEPLYDSYKNGSSIDRIVHKIVARLEDEKAFSLELIGQTKSFEAAREHIAYRLVSRKENEELLKDVPWTAWNDLAIIYYLHLGTKDGNQITSIIHNWQQKAWNLSTNELHELAKENTPKLCPSTIGRLSHMVFELDEDDELVLDDTEIPTLYVLTNQAGINGATCMLYDNVLKEFADKMDSDLIILPSSIHEVLLLEYDEFSGDMELEKFKDMVGEVNRNDVPVEDVLSDSVYIYERKDNRIRIA